MNVVTPERMEARPRPSVLLAANDATLELTDQRFQDRKRAFLAIIAGTRRESGV